MDDKTPNLSLPFIMPSQAQKHVTHNEAIRLLDVLTQMSATSRTLNEPPQNIENGTVYLVPENASGVWQGRAGQIAAYQDGAFNYLMPKLGWRIYVAGEGLLCFDGTDWVLHTGNDGGTSAAQAVTTFGINASADETNRLVVQSDSVLFNHEAGDIRTVLNKETESDTASFLFQTGFSGRAEIGLTGDDDFHFRTSPDGANFKDSLVIQSANGQVDFPHGYSSHGITSQTRNALSNLAPLLSGPGQVNFDQVSQRLRWDGRFVVINSGAGSPVSTQGFFDITQPVSGSVIAGFGTLADDTVTDTGIRLAPWEALYCVLPISGSNQSQPQNFRLVSVRQKIAFPADEIWIFVALHNGDTGEIRLGNGNILNSNQAAQSSSSPLQNEEEAPAFYAVSIADFTLGSPLKFNQTSLNRGGVYDPSTGYFTAPKSGLYKFQSYILAQRQSSAGTIYNFVFSHNNQPLPTGRAAHAQLLDPGPRFAGLSGSVLLELNLGDTLAVVLDRGALRASGRDLNYFHGHFISK